MKKIKSGKIAAIIAGAAMLSFTVACGSGEAATESVSESATVEGVIESTESSTEETVSTETEVSSEATTDEEVVKKNPVKMESYYFGDLYEVVLYTLDDEGRIIENDVYHGDGTELTYIGKFEYAEDGSYTVTSYDAEGNATGEVRTYDKNGNCLSRVSDGETDTYEYDVNGEEYSETETYSDGTVTHYLTGELNPDGTVASIEYDGGSVYKYTYNEQGLNSGWTEYDSEGNISQAVTLTYDEAGNWITRVTQYGETTNVLTNTYDEKGNLLTQEEASDGVVFSRTVNTYDEDGNLLESVYSEDWGEAEFSEVDKSVFTY